MNEYDSTTALYLIDDYTLMYLDGYNLVDILANTRRIKMNIKDIIITELETITAFDAATGNYKWTLDELQNATITQSEDSTELTGKGGRVLSTLKRNMIMRRLAKEQKLGRR